LATKKYSKTKISLGKKSSKNSIWDIFNFGESYTSLFLGIIVVIIATITLLIFAKGKNTSIIKPELAKQLTQGQNSVTPTITQIISTTDKKPTISQAKIVINPTKIMVNTKSTNNAQVIKGSDYVVIEGDTLWKIAEKKYNNGYNWVDIQKANKLANPNVIFAGTKIKLPKIEQKIATIKKATNNDKQVASSNQTSKITGNSYIVVKGDNLWDIAVRAYGDGYAWTKISSTNKLLNPNIIHSGNKLIIPRGK